MKQNLKRRSGHQERMETIREGPRCKVIWMAVPVAVCLATKLFTFGVVGRCSSDALVSTIVGDLAPSAAD